MLDSYCKWLVALCLATVCAAVSAQTDRAISNGSPQLGSPNQNPPRKTQVLHMTDMAYGEVFRLWGGRNTQALEFTLRGDHVVEAAELNLVFTPSPVLLPRMSHLRVYLNDELMGVIGIDPDEPGARQHKKIALDPRIMTRFNRVRLEFIGHNADVCRDENHSALWLDISHDTRIQLVQQMLPVMNDLAYFPEPFFDTHDMMVQSIPIVFAAPPAPEQLRAGAILSSYFGSLSRWRRAQIPVHYDALPNSHFVVLATNESRPHFLSGYPLVDGPTVDMVSHPDNSYLKMLLILGRDDNDLVAAASALAVGNAIFRGQSVRVEQVLQLAPRQPYDAPNWAPVDRPIVFSELLEYPEQLDVFGLHPNPILLSLNLPPDLFVWRNSGIPTAIRYRYSAPQTSDDSRLSLSLNGRFVTSYLLDPQHDASALARMRLAVRGSDNVSDNDRMIMPALKLGGANQLRFDFSFAGGAAAQADNCQATMGANVRAAIDEQSVIDFSGFHHYLEMPNLRSFAGSGFPFSKMADLSETIVVMPSRPAMAQTTTLFETLAGIGSQVGYPALGVRVVHDWNLAQTEDADVLLIGSMPTNINSSADTRLLLFDAQAALHRPRHPGYAAATPAAAIHRVGLLPEREVISRVMVRSLAPMAAVVGMQSEHYPQRSVVALLGTTDEDFHLLRAALADTGKRDAMRGSVVLIRESGVASEMVGPHYYVGHLPWWQKVWFALSDQPVALTLGALCGVILLSILLWIGLYRVARQRLRHVD